MEKNQYQNRLKNNLINKSKKPALFYKTLVLNSTHQCSRYIQDTSCILPTISLDDKRRKERTHRLVTRDAILEVDIKNHLTIFMI